MRLLAMLMPLLPVGGFTGTCDGSEAGVVLLASQAVGMNTPRLVYLRPGLKLSEKPPEGWTHLVVKSVPRLASGDRASLPSFATKTATLFRTVLLADVRPVDSQEKDFVLGQIGIGMCVPDGTGKDIVVTSDRLEALGLRLSTIEQAVLEVAETELAETRIIARTSTFALLRSPASLLVAGKHRKVDLFYAFCVERTTGHLRVAAWSMPSGQRSLPPPPTNIVLLGSRVTFDCAIDVQATRILGLSVNWSFAMQSLPPGRPLAVPPALGKLIAQTAQHPADVDPDELERWLMKTLSTAREYSKAVYETLPTPPYRRN